MGTFIVVLILAVITLFAGFSLYRNKKTGKGCCSFGGCSGLCSGCSEKGCGQNGSV